MEDLGAVVRTVGRAEVVCGGRHPGRTRSRRPVRPCITHPPTVGKTADPTSDHRFPACFPGAPGPGPYPGGMDETGRSLRVLLWPANPALALRLGMERDIEVVASPLGRPAV